MDIEVKVGDVRKDREGIYVITKIDKDKDCSILFNNGTPAYGFGISELSEDKLLATYPDFITAINSKEFRGEKWVI